MPDSNLEEHFDMASGSVSNGTEKKADIDIKIEESRLAFRNCVFKVALFLIFVFYTIFGYLLLWPEHLLPLIQYTPYAICLAIFAGSVPTVLFIVLLLSTFRARKRESNGIDEQNILDTFAKFASIARLIK